MARLAFDSGACTDLDRSKPVGYFPLRASMRVRGVLAVTFNEGAASLLEHQELLETVASVAAIAVERLHFVERRIERGLLIADQFRRAHHRDL